MSSSRKQPSAMAQTWALVKSPCIWRSNRDQLKVTIFSEGKYLFKCSWSLVEDHSLGSQMIGGELTGSSIETSQSVNKVFLCSNPSGQNIIWWLQHFCGLNGSSLNWWFIELWSLVIFHTALCVFSLPQMSLAQLYGNTPAASDP